jgi:hypothetical protein
LIIEISRCLPQTFPLWWTECVSFPNSNIEIFGGGSVWGVPLEPHLQPFFVLFILVIGSCFLSRLAWTAMLQFYVSHRWDDRCALSCPAFLTEMGSFETFCPDWSQTEILPISASQVVRIADVSHRTQLKYWTFNSQCDGVWRWGLWEAIRVRWVLCNGISALLKREDMGLSSLLFPIR